MLYEVITAVNKVPQCGYCQSGQIMQAAELLATNKSPNRADRNNFV